MAKIDTANLEDLLPVQHCNISDAVGVGEKNEINDVMLIQALFKLVGSSDLRAREFFGLKKSQLPDAKGSFDEITTRTIWAFQRKMSGRLLNVDGKIHPAHYQNRIIKNAFRGGRLMAITLLNMEALDTTIEIGAKDVHDAVKAVAPTIMFT